MSARTVCLLALIGSLGWLSAQAQGIESVTVDGRPLARDFGLSSLSIETSAGGRESFDVFVAERGSQHARGLMFVAAMPNDVAMIFLYPRERMISMWMKNTLISLDMLFVDSSGTIVHLAENATPGSLATISSVRPALAVVEINAGLVEHLGISVGDRVLHSFFD